LLCTSGGAVAAGSADDWQYSGTIYLWGAGIKGETAGGADFDVSFDTLINNLNMGFMGAFEARKGEWSAVADVVYLNVGGTDSGEVPIQTAAGTPVNVEVDARVKTKGWVLNLLGAYNLYTTEKAGLDVLLGARYMDLEVDFDLGLAAGQYAVQRSFSEKHHSWDAVAGFKGRLNLDEHWYIPYYADIGAGQSDLTWQLFGGVGYAFDWGDVSLVYRHIEWDFDSDSKIDNINYSGPALSATWHF
jgi:hypothetical protein